MGSLEARSSTLATGGTHLHARHPIFIGSCATLVFSGDVRVLGEITGEATAHAQRKFVLPDSGIDSAFDLALQPGMMLERWERTVEGPIDGVCFVFSDPSHAALRTIVERGGREDEHWVLVDGARREGDERGERAAALAAFVRSLPVGAPIVVLGYGHQGTMLASILRDELRTPSPIFVHESNPDASQRAVAAGFRLIDADEVRAGDWAVVSSPLQRHDRLHRLVEQARSQGRPVFDNAQASSGLDLLLPARGGVVMSRNAAPLVAVEDDALVLRRSGSAVRCAVAREDQRAIDGVEFPHLHTGYIALLSRAVPRVPLADVVSPEPLPANTLVARQRTFVGLQDRADRADLFGLGCFAARSLAERLWPEATAAVMPSRHVAELGATAFERLLLGHLVAREVVSTMQTPAQRTVLGIAARRYAADRPIVEIGSSFGGSALVMAAATGAARPQIFSIDPDAPTREIMRFAFAREGQLDRLRQIVATSDAAFAVEPELAAHRGRCGLVFIDGLHTWAGVAADIEAFRPLVALGGALVFHDVAAQIEPVMRCVWSRMLPDRSFRCVCLVDGLAIFERIAEAA
jgi:predicted O-methyltransferase YrrM